MYTGVVVGSVVSSVKDAGLEGIPLLLVRLVENGERKGLIVAADATRQAGRNDVVYLIGSKEASRVMRKPLVPVDAAIVGFIDSYNEEIPCHKSPKPPSLPRKPKHKEKTPCV